MCNKVKIRVDNCNNQVILVKRVSPYSIIKSDEEYIHLCVGLNEIDSLKYGFYFDFLSFSKNILCINLDNYDTSNIIDMSYMFHSCNKLNNLNLSKFNTRDVIDMRCMFVNCFNLSELDLSSFDTSKVITMTDMFLGCSGLTKLDLSSFDTRNVIHMTDMFSMCSNLESLDLSNFDVSNVNLCRNMFYGCYKLKHIKCKRSFKKWCFHNMNFISLPYSMIDGGCGIWEIID